MSVQRMLNIFTSKIAFCSMFCFEMWMKICNRMNEIAFRVKIQDGDNKARKCQLHLCLRHSMRVCRWAGCFPVEGLGETTISGLRFSLTGFYSILYAATFISGTLSFVLITIWLMDNDLSIHIVSDFIFYTTGFISTALVARLAKQWPDFMARVAEIEHSLEEIRISNNTHKYCIGMAFAIMIMALAEHLLAVIYGISLTLHCMPDSRDFSDIAEKYFTFNLRYYFQYIRYNHFFGVVFKIVNFQATFLWSFTDVLTICCSIYLISYFQDLNKFIKSQKDVPWERLRSHYSRVVELVMEVDARLSGFILQSFVTYIFYTCLQLFHTLNTSPAANSTDCDENIVSKVRRSPEYLSYYVFSFLFLVLRFMVTSLLAANVNLVAKKPLMALDAVPSAEYSIEVRRFRLQIEYNPVAMSGHFFLITRPMLLKVVGSIITYELVMLQIH